MVTRFPAVSSLELSDTRLCSVEEQILLDFSGLRALSLAIPDQQAAYNNDLLDLHNFTHLEALQLSG